MVYRSDGRLVKGRIALDLPTSGGPSAKAQRSVPNSSYINEGGCNVRSLVSHELDYL